MDSFQEIVNDTRQLLARESGKKRTMKVSPEVAALLEAMDEMPAAMTAPAPSPAVSPDDDARVAQLAELAETVRACTRCGLCKVRTQTVFGDGNPYADLVFVGEAPGASEDRQGKPFVGLAGQLLTDIIVKGMQMQRSDVYICNVIKCRPPDNRNPEPEEVAQCEPYLIRQLEVIRPKVICALGAYAAQCLLRTSDTVGRLRGKWHSYQGIPLRVTYHPAYLLRSPEEKKKTWEDIKAVIRLLKGSD